MLAVPAVVAKDAAALEEKLALLAVDLRLRRGGMREETSVAGAAVAHGEVPRVKEDLAAVGLQPEGASFSHLHGAAPSPSNLGSEAEAAPASIVCSGEM